MISTKQNKSQLNSSKSKFKGMRFCKQCDNMLEPQEHRSEGDNSYLQFVCNMCHHYERAATGDEVDNCVYRTDYTTRAENLNVDPECIKDPTLSRRKDI